MLPIFEYVKGTRETAVYPGAMKQDKDAVDYVVHGVTGEAGEIANKFKKVLRKDYTLGDFRVMASKEIGDLMWYVARLCDELGLDLESILAQNLAKLRDRKARGVIQGSGDDR